MWCETHYDSLKSEGIPRDQQRRVLWERMRDGGWFGAVDDG